MKVLAPVKKQLRVEGRAGGEMECKCVVSKTAGELTNEHTLLSQGQ